MKNFGRISFRKSLRIPTSLWKSRIPTSLEVALEVVDSHFAGAQFRTQFKTAEREREFLGVCVSENEPLERYL